MTGEDTTTQSNSRQRFTRRTFLRTAVAGSATVGATGLASGTPGRGNGGEGGNDSGGGFPPKGITEYGREVELGNGNVRTFTTETPSGRPKYHGVEFDRAALEELPSADDLANSGDDRYTDKYELTGEALPVHTKWSLEFFVDFPDAEHTPFTFLGLNWNPGGHPGGGGAWLVPHFDVHFHMLDAETVDAIEGPGLPSYDEITARDAEGVPTEIASALDPEQIPHGYARSPPAVAEERYVTDMGEHLAPVDAPEVPANPGAFTNTLIQGFVGLDGDGASPNTGQNPELAFVEPMVTRAFLRNLDGQAKSPIRQPEVYPHDQQHPTGYSVRDVPSKDAVAVVVEDFQQV